MIYLTGDTHGELDIHKLGNSEFIRQKDMSKSDYVIILGDFGLVWNDRKSERYWLNWLNERNFTTLFVDGNHENFDRLRQYKTEEMFNGIVRRINDSVFHLERGQVLDIDGNNIFIMGGARSIDKELRIEGVSWWRDEIPSLDEMNRGIEALERVQFKVDYVLTHCAPYSIHSMITNDNKKDPIISYFEYIMSVLEFKRWYFGHYHIDKIINDKFIAMYDKIMPLY